MSYASTRELLSTRDWLRHSELVLRRIDEASSNLLKVDSAVRGYAIKGQTAYLATLERDGYLAQQAVSEAKNLTVDRPSLTTKLARLESMVKDRLSLVRQYIQVRKAKGLAAAAVLHKTEVTLKIREQITELEDSCRNQEQGVLAGREQRASASLRAAMVSFWSSTVAGLFLLGGFYLIAAKLLVAQRQLHLAEGRRANLAEDERDRFFSLSLDLLCISNADGYFKRVSPAFTRTLGWSVDQMLTRPFLDFVHPDDKVATKAEVDRQVQTGEEVLQFENRYSHLDGSWRTLSWRSVPQPGGMMYATARDVTENKRIARALDDKNRDLEQFAHVASHDLQEPLRMVASFMQLLEKKYKGQLDEQADRWIHHAVDGATRMQSLIQDLLTYSRLGSQDNECCACKMEEVIARSLQNLQLVVSESLADITMGPMPAVTGDKIQLISLFQNLIGNAIKYRGGSPPNIHISAERDGSDWLFSVRDNGIGIDPQFAERIFVIFQRLHTRKAYPGTGIGLALCKRIVERHGGCIRMESELGHGSIFLFNLPASDKEVGSNGAAFE